MCGGPGCGKTLFAMQFLIRGALDYDEPGVIMAFEETETDLKENVASLGYDLQELIDQNKLLVDYVHVERSEIEEAGEYDLEGLFIRLDQAVASVGAKRVVLDTIEVLFGGFSNVAVLRTEIRRLFRWLKDRNLTVVITGERGEGQLTRFGLEEYISDCVILLDHRVTNQVSTRRLRVVKYRGSAHGTNEYPFLIDEHGMTVLPITSLSLRHTASLERVSSGIPALDMMMGGSGYFRGSSILVSGTSGAGKTSVAASFAEAACRRGERCLYFAFEEAPDQIIRNMRSIGLDLGRWVKQGLLKIQATRPTHYGLEMHLSIIHRAIETFQPHVVVLDPLSNLISNGSQTDVQSMLTRLIDYLKGHQITALFTSLTSNSANLEQTDARVSSLIDTWLLLSDLVADGERNRGLYLLKSRGMPHSNQIREFRLTEHGVELLDAYLGPPGVLTGSARAAREAEERATKLEHQQSIATRRRQLERKREALEAQIASLRATFEAELQEELQLIDEAQDRAKTLSDDRQAIARLRHVGPNDAKRTTRDR